MNNFLLKTQINDNPPQLCWTHDPFDINNGAAIKKNLNYLMRCHFLDTQPQRFWVDWTKPMQFEYGIGEQVLVDGDLVNQCFTRESARAYVANNTPLGWDGTPEAFKNLVLATPDDKLNDFLAPYTLSVPAFDKPTSYRDTLKILRTTADDTVHLSNDLQFIDAFDSLKVQVENHVTELDNSGSSVATLKDDAIIFTAGAMIVVNEGPTEDEGTEISYIDFYAATSQSDITLSARDYISSLNDNTELYLTLTSADKTISKTQIFDARTFKVHFGLHNGSNKIFVNGNELFPAVELGYTEGGTMSWGFGYFNDELYNTSFGGYEIEPPFPSSVGHAGLSIGGPQLFHVVRTDNLNDVANIFDLSDGLFRHWDRESTRWDKNL